MLRHIIKIITKKKRKEVMHLIIVNEQTFEIIDNVQYQQSILLHPPHHRNHESNHFNSKNEFPNHLTKYSDYH